MRVREKTSHCNPTVGQLEIHQIQENDQEALVVLMQLESSPN
jgi:hypothetical protein